MEKTRIGLLGAGRIVGRVLNDLHRLEHAEVIAVAARDLHRAQEAAKRCGAPYAFGSYEELAQSGNVDLVYIATPHPFHAQQAMLMMNHGKHVICEKPMAVNDREVQHMIDCAQRNGVFLMEAMWTRFLPCIQEMMRLVRNGAIGEVRNVFGEFSWSTGAYDPADRVFNPALAGGALLDIGVYPLMMSMQLLGREPETVQSLCRKSPEGIDMNTSVQMQFPGGAVAQFFCGMDAGSHDVLHIFGTKGHITVPKFWNPESFTLAVEGRNEQIMTFEQDTEGFHYEFDHAAQCIRQGMKESPVMPLAESLAASRICTEVRYRHGIVYPGEERSDQ